VCVCVCFVTYNSIRRHHRIHVATELDDTEGLPRRFCDFANILSFDFHSSPTVVTHTAYSLELATDEETLQFSATLFLLFDTPNTSNVSKYNDTCRRWFGTRSSVMDDAPLHDLAPLVLLPRSAVRDKAGGGIVSLLVCFVFTFVLFRFDSVVQLIYAKHEELGLSMVTRLLSLVSNCPRFFNGFFCFWGSLC
jgi:hypothetical protein